jgi:hypothetical protein
MSMETNTVENLVPPVGGQDTVKGNNEGLQKDDAIKELQNQILFLNQQLQALQFSQLPSIKVAPPDSFDGNKSKTEDFINQLNFFFHGKRIISDYDRMVLALSYMKGGSAGSWVKQKSKEVHEGSQSWNSFLAEFRQRFGDPDAAGTARHKLSVLKQGNHDAEQYVTSFKEHKDLTGFNDPALVELFKKGLKADLYDQIFRLPEMPTDLDGWMTWAVKLDRQWRKGEEEKKLLGISFPKFAKPSSFVMAPQSQLPSVPAAKPQAAPPAKQSDVVPMEIDSGRRNKGPLVCFKCRKAGHIARNCQSRFNINSMDYEALKAFMKEEIEKDKQVFEEGSGEGHVPAAQ